LRFLTAFSRDFQEGKQNLGRVVKKKGKKALQFKKFDLSKFSFWH
jgi:hypothetical protein